MAEASSSAAGQRDATLRLDAPAATGIRGQSPLAEADDDSEWEYEYSTTETDTYYLTVDLSLPEFKTVTKKTPIHSRGGYYKTWLQTPQEAIERSSGPNRTQESTRAASVNDNEEEAEPAPAAVDDDMADIDPSLRAAPEPTVDREVPTPKNKRKAVRMKDGVDKEDDSEEEENEASAQDIQILNLHSERPIFSYRGRIFEGQWAENVGTEMILTEHDEDSAATVPVLRNLAGDVDLLAASASRIITKEKTLKPKVEREDTLGPIRKEWNINIPKGAYKMSERAKQGDFLEKLMALKIKKGEKDQVTVYARRADDDGLSDGAKPKRRKRTRNSGDEAGRGRARGRRRRGRNRSLATETLHGDIAESQQSLSVPTPQRWADLETSGSREKGTVPVQESDDEDDIFDGNEFETEYDQQGRDDDEPEEEEDDDELGQSDGNGDEMDEDDDEDEDMTPGVRSNTARAID